jgi:sugar/nucleoside kinase (ribokinase family)
VGRSAAPDPPDLLVAGSIALDTLEGGYGRVEDELGGSALYFALAASLVRPVRLLAPIGADALKRVHDAVAGRPIDISLLELVDAPTYRWRAQAVAGRNRDLGNRDSIYDHWSPHPPEGYSGWAFLGSMRPDRQLEAARGLAGSAVLAADAMLSYISARPAAASEVLEIAGWYFCNADELAALGGGSPEEFRRRHHLEGLVVKAGPDGATVYTEEKSWHLPALIVRPVVDTTGAGDSLAGALLARLSLTGDLEEALRWGVAAASIAIEDVGIRALVRAVPADLAERVRSSRSSS